jgi:nucleoside triphosphate pyrophosphatase
MPVRRKAGFMESWRPARVGAEYSLAMSGVTDDNAGGAAGAKLVLASRSPRRRMLLDESGLRHDAQHPGFEDSVLERGKVSAEQWIGSLAYLKAWARAGEPGASGRLVIGADTACLVDGELVGTPRDADEAEAMIRRFVGREHDVLTGVAIIDLRDGGSVAGGEVTDEGRPAGTLEPVTAPSRRIFVDRARVRLGRLGEEQIRAYIASGAWMGKAGAYNYREALAAGWPLSCDGDVTTVMGLPMAALRRQLAAMGVVGSTPIVTAGTAGEERIVRGAVA